MSATAAYSSPQQRNYEQIDTIRFITICFIIWGHTLVGWENRPTHGTFDEVMKMIVYQTGKVSTIIFFVVSGFLLRPKLQGYTLKSYFKERSPRVYLPWVFFIILFQFISILHQVPLAEIWENRDLRLFVRLNYNILDGLLLYSAYWFITTYMVSMVVLVLFRKHAESWMLGAAFAAITLFYAVNLYYGWIEANHSKAILGYVLFIWVGMKVNRHFDRIQNWLARVPWAWLGGSVFVLFALACIEGYTLSTVQCVDPYASNRISNIFLSLLFFLALLKMGTVGRINRLQPRKTVYGIYLIHNILIFELSRWIGFFFAREIEQSSLWLCVLYQIAFFTVILILTYQLVRRLAESKFCWVIGIKVRE